MSGHGDVIRTTRAWFEACLAAEARAVAAEKETATLRAALAEASTHVHDCLDLLTPATRRAISESVALLTSEAAL